MVRPIQRATILLLLLLFLPLSCHAENLKASLDPKVSTTQNPILLGNSSQDVDYSLVEEDIEEVESTNKTSVIESSTENTLAQQYLNTLLPEEAPAEGPILDESRLVENAPGMITNMSDIVKLVRFVFLRGHIVLDASHRVLVKNESRIERLMDYLHDIQLRRGKHRVLPMDDRDLGCEAIPDSKLHLKELCNAATFDCLSASEIIQMLPPSISFHQAITRICPLLLFRQSRPICIADVKKLIDVHLNQKIKLVEPSIERVWAFGVLFVTISIVVSMGGLMLLPFLSKSSRTRILIFFEGLAVGGLAGSAIIHLFPQAFDIADDKYQKYFWITSFVFGGIYLFYLIEIFLKFLKIYSHRNPRKRVPSTILFRDDEVYFEPKLRASLSPASSNNNFLSDCKGSVYQIKYATSSDSSDDDTDDYQQPMGKKINVTPEERASFDSLRRNIPALAQHERDWSPERAETTVRSMTAMVPNSLTGAKEALISSTREQLAQCLSTVNVMQPAPPTNLSLLIQRKNLPSSPVPRPFKERMVSNVAIRRQDHETSNIIVIDTFAWMIVLGDALLNFIDGLSIGAAFDRNILAGMSISVAVMLEEVTHRLGTFAVLIRAGMSMKQSFFWIFLSACACYPGLALGIFLGDEAEEFGPYIFSLSAGFFLYMALTMAMTRISTRIMENASRKNIRTMLQTWALQNFGIVLSIISLGLLAYYEKAMDLVSFEIAEIKGNSFV